MNVESLTAAFQVLSLVVTGIGTAIASSIYFAERSAFWWTRPHFREARREIVQAGRAFWGAAERFFAPPDLPRPGPVPRGIATAMFAISMYFYAVTFAVYGIALLLVLLLGAHPLPFPEFLGAMAFVMAMTIGWRKTASEGARARRELHQLAAGTILSRRLW